MTDTEKSLQVEDRNANKTPYSDYTYNDFHLDPIRTGISWKTERICWFPRNEHLFNHERSSITAVLKITHIFEHPSTGVTLLGFYFLTIKTSD